MADPDVQAEIDTLKKELAELAGELVKLAGVVSGLSGDRPVTRGAAVASSVQTAANQIATRNR